MCSWCEYILRLSYIETDAESIFAAALKKEENNLIKRSTEYFHQKLNNRNFIAKTRRKRNKDIGNEGWYLNR